MADNFDAYLKKTFGTVADQLLPEEVARLQNAYNARETYYNLADRNLSQQVGANLADLDYTNDFEKNNKKAALAAYHLNVIASELCKKYGINREYPEEYSVQRM